MPDRLRWSETGRTPYKYDTLAKRLSLAIHIIQTIECNIKFKMAFFVVPNAYCIPMQF